jgi:peptidoglycan/LPS O-acetylase OafA/YrhL
MRIVPAFWAVLTIQLLFGGFFHASIGQLVLTYGFAQNLTHGPITRVMNQAWTLDVECAFYVFVPILMLLLSACCRGHGRVKRTQVFLVALVLMAAASVCARAFGPGAFAWQTALPSMLVAFLPGVALAVAETTSVPEWLARRSGRVPAALVLAGLAVLGVYSAGAWAARPPLVGTQSVDAVGFLLASLGAAGVVAGFRAREYTVGSSWRVIDNRVLRWIGVRSYSLYLVHRAVALAVVIVASSVASTAGARLVILLPIVVAVSVAAAAASFRYVERPAMRAQAIVGGRADRRLQRASEAQGALCG